MNIKDAVSIILEQRINQIEKNLNQKDTMEYIQKYLKTIDVLEDLVDKAVLQDYNDKYFEIINKK